MRALDFSDYWKCRNWNQMLTSIGKLKDVLNSLQFAVVQILGRCVCVCVCVCVIHFLANTYPLFCVHHLPHLFMLIYAVGGSFVYEPQRAA